MKFRIYWEQEQYDVELQEKDGEFLTTPLGILEQIGEQGRDDFRSLLLANFSDDDSSDE